MPRTCLPCHKPSSVGGGDEGGDGENRGEKEKLLVARRMPLP